MGRTFDIPSYYRSSIVSSLKAVRTLHDQRKRDLSPTVLDVGRIKFKLARHFGFCFGVENAIEIAYRAVKENPGRNVFLLSEMIHNPHVNDDLRSKGVRFLMAPDGAELIPFETLQPRDIVIVPAFGTTVSIFDRLSSLGLDPWLYNATCPFVEKVWKRAEQLGQKGYTVIIHGKHSHEETQATFSHAALTAPSLVIRDVREAVELSRFIRGELGVDAFNAVFAERVTPKFNPAQHLLRIGVVNQTTMLATETQTISEILRAVMREVYGEENLNVHFADTRDTLCYATSENQDAVKTLIESGGDLSVVVGGYNSSNTSHLVELCEQQVPTFYVKDADELIGANAIRHLDMHSGAVKVTSNWLPIDKEELTILVTAGASCPDALVDRVITRLAEILNVVDALPQAVSQVLRADGTITANS